MAQQRKSIRHKSLRHKSIRRKSLRHKNRTTLKRGGVIEKEKKITDYFKGKKPHQPIISKNRQTPRVFNTVSDLTADMTEEQKARKPTPPRDCQFPDIQTTMPEEQKAKIQKSIDARLAAYLYSNGFPDSNSYPPVKRVIRKI